MTEKDIALEENFQPRVKDPEHYTPIFLTPEMDEEIRKKEEEMRRKLGFGLTGKDNSDANSGGGKE